MIEKILVLLLFFPISVYTTIQYGIINWGKDNVLIGSNKKIEKTGEWSKAQELRTLRYEFGAARINNDIYVIGGLFLPTVYGATNKVEAYNIKTNSWKEAAPLPVIIHHPGVTSDGKYIYVIGGNGFKITPYNSAFRYDPQENTWEKLPDMPSKRGALGLVAVNGKIYAIGGAELDKKLDAVEIYDPKTKTWEKGKNMPTAREHLGIAVVGEKIYVLGGFKTDRYNSLKTVEVYDTKTNTWEKSKDLPLPLSGFAAASVGNKVVVFGGQQGLPVSDEVHEYDTEKDKWSRRRDLAIPRYGLVGVTDGNKVHLFGGSKTVGGYEIVKVHEVYTVE